LGSDRAVRPDEYLRQRRRTPPREPTFNKTIVASWWN
jgi:hypothetical protein